jgi:hypothetical protein
MPERIAALLNAESSQNSLTGVVPVLASLMQRNRRVETAYLCDEKTTQIYKLNGEGNHFCAYRNIQMMLLQIQYSIPELQDMIELAWDQGYNSHGRIETGGIKGTRKHIGTSEVGIISSNGSIFADGVSGRSSFTEFEHAVHCEGVLREEGMACPFGRGGELLHTLRIKLLESVFQRISVPNQPPATVSSRSASLAHDSWHRNITA